MKKRLLSSVASLLLLTTLTVSNAEVTDNKQQTQKAEVDSATQAQQAFTALSDAMLTSYQTSITMHPLVESISYTTQNYEKGQDSSTATTKGTLNFSTEIEGKKSFDLNFKHQIKHDAATLANGVIAQIDSTIVKPKELDEAIIPLVNNLSYTTTIKKDHSFIQQMSLKPTTIEEDGDKVVVNGFEWTIQSTIQQIADGGFGDFNFDFKGISGKDSDDIEVFSFQPMGFKGTYQPNGELNAASTAPLIFQSEDQQLQIDRFSAKGNLKMSKKYNMFLGKIVYEMSKLSVTSDDFPMPLSLDSLRLESDNQINDKNIWSQHAHIKLIPGAGLTAMLSQGMLDISAVNIDIALDNIPATVLMEYQKFTKLFESGNDLEDGDSEDSEQEAKIEKKLAEIFDTVKAQGGKLDLIVNLASAEGQVLLDAKTQMKPDSNVTLKDIQAADSPQLLLQALSINLDVSVPAPLLEKTGMQMKTAPFLQKNGDVYQAEISNDSGELLINDMPVPF